MVGVRPAALVTQDSRPTSPDLPVQEKGKHIEGNGSPQINDLTSAAVKYVPLCSQAFEKPGIVVFFLFCPLTLVNGHNEVGNRKELLPGQFFPGSRRFCFLVAMPFVYLENGRRHFYGSCLHGAQESRSRSSAQRLPTGPGERAPPAMGATANGAQCGARFIPALLLEDIDFLRMQKGLARGASLPP